MPIYEYQCASCGHQLEAFQKISEAPLTDCPNCHRADLQKLISAAGFQLKGTGWYATDFKNKGKPAEQKADKSESSDSTTSPTSQEKGKEKDAGQSSSGSSSSTTSTSSTTGDSKQS